MIWLYCRMVWKTFFPPPDSFVRPTVRRMLLMVFFLPLVTLIQLLHWLGLLLDELFFPGYRRVEVRQPIFIVGVPRSGTTWLQKILADDPQMTGFRAWEILFAPSITEWKFWTAVGAADSRLGGFGRRLLLRFQSRLFRSMEHLHPLSLFEHEEDDFVQVPALGSTYLTVVFPFPEMLHLLRFDKEIPRAEQDRVMKFYRSCVQRHLYVHGPEKHFLSKNPTFTTRIEALGRFFPDARILYCSRTPFEVVPSVLSLMDIPWQAFGNDPRGDRFRDLIVDLMVHWYQYPVACLRHWPDDRHHFVDFRTLTSAPGETIGAIYERFGLGISDGFRARLREADRQSRSYRSPHAYSLAQFNLSREEVREKFAEAFRQFHFPATPAATLQPDESPPCEVSL